MSFNPHTLLDVLELRAQRNPEKIVYTLAQSCAAVPTSISYSALAQEARAGATELSKIAKSGERGLILLPHTIDYIRAFFSCIYAGVIAVPAHIRASFYREGDAGLQSLIAILENCGATVIVTTSDLRSRIESLLQKRWNGRVVSLVDLQSGDPAAWQAPEIDSASLCHLQYTSGSTRSARAVMVSHANLLSNMKMIERAFGLESDSVIVSWLPFFHDMGLITMLEALYCGASMVFLSPADFMRRPFRWLKTISDYKGTVSGGPNFAFELCAKQIDISECAALDLSSWSIAFSGAETVRAETIEKFAGTFSSCGFRRQAFRPCYGLAEATVMVSVCKDEQGPTVKALAASKLQEGDHNIGPEFKVQGNNAQVVSCGPPCEGVRVAIVDPTNAVELGDGHIGEIWASGPNIAAGYWNNASASSQTFGAELQGCAVRFLRTGDLGFKSGEEIFVTGRLKELIIIRGKNYVPADIEDSVRRHAGEASVGHCSAFAIEHASEQKLIVLAEVSEVHDARVFEEAARRIRSAVFGDFELHIHTLYFLPRRALPFSSSGKLQRVRSRDLFLSGSLRPAHADIQAAEVGLTGAADCRLLEKFAYLFKYDGDCRSKRTLEELGVDSLDLAMLAADLERSFQSFDHERIDISVLYSLTLDDCYRLLSEPQGPFVEELFRRAMSAESSSPDIKSDALLEMEIPGTCRQSKPLSCGPILLTGATGFVGSFLLKELLMRTKERIVLLVRASTRDHARSRVRQSLLDHGLLDEALERAESRLEYVPGDLAKPKLGLESSDWLHLADEVGVIFHNGAAVNYISPYEKLRPANVHGTRAILELATRARPKFLHYISSTFVFGWATELVHESDRNANLANVDFGYSQSKWAAEQLVWQARERGVAARVYRPAMLTASRKAQFSTSDVTGAFLLYFINHQVYADIPNQISLMPIDFFVKRLVDFAEFESPSGDTFHFTMEYASLPSLCAAISRQFGYSFRPLSLTELSEHLRTFCTPKDLFFPFVNFYHRHYKKIEQMKAKRYVRENYLATSKLLGAAEPEPLVDEIVAPIVRYFQERGLIHAKPAS